MAVVQQLKRKKTTAADLPEEVVHREIFTRLPIKTVARFKCVSKSWLSLFSNPQFVKQHLTLNTNENPNDYDRLIAQKKNLIVIVSRYQERFALPSCSFKLVGSIRGLVCVQGHAKLSLWNPAIHQSKEFTLPPQRSCSYCFTIGFGFDPLSDNYKVVVLSPDFRFASAYYSNSDDWIDIIVPGNVFPKDVYSSMDSSITIVKDCPFWTFARFTEGRHPNKLHRRAWTGVYLTAVKFDARTNEFKLLPELYFDLNVRAEDYGFKFTFVDMNDCLCVIVHDFHSLKSMLDIYALDGEDECCVWSKMYSIGPLDCPKVWHVSQGFYGGEIVFHDYERFLCYEHKTDTIKCLGSSNFFMPCFRYMPSLVFLEGMKSVYLTTQTRGTASRVPRRLINSLRE